MQEKDNRFSELMDEMNAKEAKLHKQYRDIKDDRVLAEYVITMGVMVG